ncbi:hypothetical protein [Pedobacter sp. L105]|uniref:hypothetical protein n=1 Tax=Pedobacter sp. L105 TaxID=1641871 RepID=UPI00131A9A51|nr:hypothetical protein [Pedobacter sp. L105]
MIDQRFTELLGRKLSNEISEDENQEFLRLISENEVYKKEYETLSGYFQEKDEKPYENAASLFQKIKNRINPST